MDNDDCLITNAVIKQPKYKQDPAPPGHVQHTAQHVAPTQPYTYQPNSVPVSGHQLSHQQRSMQPNTWDGIQANFRRQQYLTSSQPQFQSQQQPHRLQTLQNQQHQQHQQHHYQQGQQWPNSFTQHQQNIALNNAQNTLSGLNNSLVQQHSQQNIAAGHAYPGNNYASQHSTVFRNQSVSQAGSLGTPQWPQQSSFAPIPTQGSQVPTSYMGAGTFPSSNTVMAVGSVGASPTPPRPQQTTYNRMPSGSHSSQGASFIPSQMSSINHKHFICEFNLNGRTVSLQRCLNDKCQLVQVDDGGFSQVIHNWLFIGPLDVKVMVKPYADKLISEERYKHLVFCTKMDWLCSQPNSKTGVRINDLAPPDIKVTAKISDESKGPHVSPGAAASPSVSPGVAQQHQQLSQVNQAQLMAQVQQAQLTQKAHIEAQPRLAQENYATLQRHMNIGSVEAHYPQQHQSSSSQPNLNSMSMHSQQQQSGNTSVSPRNSLPPPPPLHPRPDIGSVAAAVTSGNAATSTLSTVSPPNESPDSTTAGGTKLQTEDDWDRYLAQTGQSILVIAPEPELDSQVSQRGSSITTAISIEDDDSPENNDPPPRKSASPVLKENADPPPSIQSCTDENIGTSETTGATLSTRTSPSVNTAVIGTVTVDSKEKAPAECVSESADKLDVTSQSKDSNDNAATKVPVGSDKTEAIVNEVSASHLADIGLVLEPVCDRTEENVDNSISSTTVLPAEPPQLPPLSFPQGDSSVPEFINLDLMDDICLTPDKIFSTNPLDKEIDELEEVYKVENKSKENISTNCEKKPVKRKRLIQDSDIDSIGSSEDENKNYKTRRKRRRNQDDDDEDYIPDSSPDRTPSRGRWASDSYDSYESSATSDSLSIDTDSETDSDDNIVRKTRSRRRRRRRRRRRAYISDSSEERPNTDHPNSKEERPKNDSPDFGVQIHRLTRREIKVIKKDLRRGTYLCVKRSLDCSRCKFIKRARRKNYTDLALGNTSEDESSQKRRQSISSSAVNEEKTVVSYCSERKEPIHEPTSGVSRAPGTVTNDSSSEAIEHNFISQDISDTKDASEIKLTNDSVVQREDLTLPNEAVKDKGIEEEMGNVLFGTKDRGIDEEMGNVLFGTKDRGIDEEMGNVLFGTSSSTALETTENQRNLQCDGEVWTDVDEIKSEKDLLMMLEEFQSRKQVHACKCGIMYMDHTSFWLHKTNAHKPDNIFACGICGHVCTSARELEVHFNDTSCDRRDNL